jgi:SAM-dependent methyltransferase
MLVSSRSLDEYRHMFGLSDADLTGAILDCPGGCASFAAEATELGATVTAVDPEYAIDTATLREQGIRTVQRGVSYHLEHPDQYVWTYFTDADHYVDERIRAVERFAEDRTAHPERYVTAMLPNLPFADGHFDLALMSHLLFSYLDRLDEDFHVAAITELTRVARQARIFPLAPMGSERYDGLPRFLEKLADQGIDAEVRPVAYEFQRGCTEMLVVARA